MKLCFSKSRQSHWDYDIVYSPNKYRETEGIKLRLRGQSKIPKQITLSFNPIVASHWLKSYFFDRTVENSMVLKTTYLDNVFLDDAYKMTLENMKETDYYHYMVYALIA